MQQGHTPGHRQPKQTASGGVMLHGQALRPIPARWCGGTEAPGQVRCSKHRSEGPGGLRISRGRGQALLGNTSQLGDSQPSAKGVKSWARGNLQGQALPKVAPQNVYPAPFSYPPPPNTGSEGQKPTRTPGSSSGAGGTFGGARMSYPAPSSSLALNHRICMKIHTRCRFCSARNAELLF